MAMRRYRSNEHDRSVFSRRALVLFGAQGALATALGARMYQLQIVEGEKYAARADRARIRPSLLAPVRGQIVSRDGKPLAVNRHNYRIVLYREDVEEVEETLDRLSDLIPLPPLRRKALTEEIRRTRAFLPVVIAENLKWEEFAEVNANAPALAGISPELGLTRHYPEADFTGHLVGYVAAASERDVERAGKDGALIKLPGMRIGKSGVERVEEIALRGKAGLSRVEKDAHGRPIRELERREGTPGEDLTLTVNMALQKYAMQRMGEESGAVVVMDIYDGDVLAMASTPGFDPNGFVLGLSQKDWLSLRDNEKKPLSNKAVSGLYPPGSTFKMVVAMAALEAGLVGPGHSVYCGGHIELGSHRFHCWKRGGHGTMNLHQGLKQSCDVYFYDLAKRIGIDKLAETARKFGIGVLPEIGLVDAKAGLMPDKTWKRAKLKEPWYPGETLHAGIGQGYLLGSPLQLAVMAARIANGGYEVHPRLVRSRNGERVRSRSLRGTGIDKAHVEAVQRGMYGVVNEPGGTAYRSRIALAGHEMCGKTGTAQVRRITTAERATGVLKNSELPWKERDHALFVAFTPADDPRYAISVIVEHGGGGSKVAAPIARDVLLKLKFPTEIPEGAIPAGADPVFTAETDDEDESEDA